MILAYSEHSEHSAHSAHAAMSNHQESARTERYRTTSVYENLMLRGTSNLDNQLISLIRQQQHAQTSFDSTNTYSFEEDVYTQLEIIKESFGLNRSQLSKILDVSRPQLNKWLDGQVLPQKEDANKKISVFIAFLNKEPKDNLKYFGKFAKRYVDSDRTLLQYLSGSMLDLTSLENVYGEILPDIEKLRSKKRILSKNIASADILLPPC
jgi:DNA-binding transcriptional regulator YiaG